MFTRETLGALEVFGFTSSEIIQIEKHGWLRHKDSKRFDNACLRASLAGWHVTPPNWPNAKDPDSGWYVIAPKGSYVQRESDRYSRMTREGM